MTQLEVNYDINKEDVPILIAGIKSHLTPKGPKNSIATEIELEKFRESLPDNPQTRWAEKKELIRTSFMWDFAAYYAKDLRLFPELENLSHDGLHEFFRLRYAIPRFSGHRSDYQVDMFGKSMEGFGDHPLTITLTPDMTELGTGVFLLLSYYKKFKEAGKQAMLDDIIEVGTKMKGVAPQYDAVLAGMPRTEEEFQERIRKQKERVINSALDVSVNMLRFYWDFLGKPVNDYAKLNNIKVISTGLEWNISQKDLEVIIQHPTLRLTDIVKRLFPKNKEEFKTWLDVGEN